MILGLFISNYKGYGETTFIPLSSGDNFTALIGENGSGKTTVLLALDSFFNNRTWEKNIYLKEASGEDAFIQPVFLIPKDKVPEELQTEALEINRRLWHYRQERNHEVNDLPAIVSFHEFLKTFPPEMESASHLLFSVALTNKSLASDPVFALSTMTDPDRWLLLIREIYHYLCVPSMPDPEIIMAFAGKKELVLKNYARDICEKEFDSLPVSLLDSQQKQQLTIGLLEYMKKIFPDGLFIIGLDEPEATLQTSACYEHFERIYRLHGFSTQIILTSHWYGFIPLLTSGLLVDIIREKQIHRFLRFDISRFREDIKIRKRLYMEKFHEELPVDIGLKTLNDFIQALIGSVINKPYYNWLICEGSSEKIYFNYYFGQEIRDGRLRIVPVGGVREVKKIFSYLSVAFSDLRDYIHGTVVLLTDTDTQLLEFDTPSVPHLHCFRLVNAHGDTELVHITSNPKSPRTEIEDVLNGKVFHRALLAFKQEYPELLDFVKEEDVPETPSYYALNLSPSDNQKLTKFFDAHHHNKFRFATRYVEICREGDFSVPEWISRLRELLT